MVVLSGRRQSPPRSQPRARKICIPDPLDAPPIRTECRDERDPMTPLEQELRQIAAYGGPDDVHPALLAEAADSITELRSQVEALSQQLTLCQQERDRRIEPLHQSDDPEAAEAVRMTPDYVLMTRRASDQQHAMYQKRRESTAQQLREAFEAGWDAQFEYFDPPRTWEEAYEDWRRSHSEDDPA